jgi:hypothetical protein
MGQRGAAGVTSREGGRAAAVAPRLAASHVTQTARKHMRGGLREDYGR